MIQHRSGLDLSEKVDVRMSPFQLLVAAGDSQRDFNCQAQVDRLAPPLAIACGYDGRISRYSALFVDSPPPAAIL
jgi:hypothetical protein